MPTTANAVADASTSYEKQPTALATNTPQPNAVLRADDSGKISPSWLTGMSYSGGTNTITASLSIQGAATDGGPPGASSQSIADNGTITLPTAGICANVATSTAANKTGVIVTAGTVDGQFLLLINTSSNSLTMATAATSNVSSGVSCVIAALEAKFLVWQANAARWFPVKN